GVGLRCLASVPILNRRPLRSNFFPDFWVKKIHVTECIDWLSGRLGKNCSSSVKQSAGSAVREGQVPGRPPRPRACLIGQAGEAALLIPACSFVEEPLMRVSVRPACCG